MFAAVPPSAPDAAKAAAASKTPVASTSATFRGRNMVLSSLCLDVLAPAALELIDVDRRDQDEADRDLLPKRLDVHDHQAVVQHRGDEHTDRGSHHEARAAV